MAEFNKYNVLVGMPLVVVGSLVYIHILLGHRHLSECCSLVHPLFCTLPSSVRILCVIMMQGGSSSSKFREPLFGKPIEKRGGDNRIQVRLFIVVVSVTRCSGAQ